MTIVRIFLDSISSLKETGDSEHETLQKEAGTFLATQAKKEATHSRIHRGPFLADLEFQLRFHPEQCRGFAFFIYFFLSLSLPR